MVKTNTSNRVLSVSYIHDENDHCEFRVELPEAMALEMTTKLNRINSAEQKSRLGSLGPVLIQLLRHLGYASKAIGICAGEETEVWFLHSKVCGEDARVITAFDDTGTPPETIRSGQPEIR